MNAAKRTTGTDMKLFLGLDDEIKGFMHIKPPRHCPEYEQLSVAEITRRIQDDIKELVARACPAAGQEWATTFAQAWWRDWGVPHNKRVQRIPEKLANELRRGLWEEINSTDSDTAKKAQEELKHLVDKYFEAEPKHAANALAFVTRQAATWLENLSVKRAELMREVARGLSLWPVNLGVKQREQTGKDGKKRIRTVITRLAFAEKYLKGLGVNTNSQWPESAYSGAEERSPFHVAAVGLHRDLLLMKRNPKWYFLKPEKRGWVLNMTPWAQKLVALPEPMTTANAAKWWKVAKFWLDEQWEANCEVFNPLIASCNSKGKPLIAAPLFDSEVKSRVIDLRLNEAFFALAQPADL